MDRKEHWERVHETEAGNEVEWCLRDQQLPLTIPGSKSTHSGDHSSVHSVRGPAACEGKARDMDRKSHWERVYETKASDAVSWFQSVPTVSVRLLESAGLGPGT
jgi:hypothetical protein